MAFDHRPSGAVLNPYASVMGSTFVGIDETSAITVLDSARSETLLAWTTRLVPGDHRWPSSVEIDTVQYIDAVLGKAPSLRRVVLGGIDVVESKAHELHAIRFASLGEDEQVAILREVETNAAPEAFSVVLELTYEAYYRSRIIQEAVRNNTGFDNRNPVQGRSMIPFDTSSLNRVSLLPDRYRSAS